MLKNWQHEPFVAWDLTDMELIEESGSVIKGHFCVFHYTIKKGLWKTVENDPVENDEREQAQQPATTKKGKLVYYDIVVRAYEIFGERRLILRFLSGATHPYMLYSSAGDYEDWRPVTVVSMKQHPPSKAVKTNDAVPEDQLYWPCLPTIFSSSDYNGTLERFEARVKTGGWASVKLRLTALTGTGVDNLRQNHYDLTGAVQFSPCPNSRKNGVIEFTVEQGWELTKQTKDSFTYPTNGPLSALAGKPQVRAKFSPVPKEGAITASANTPAAQAAATPQLVASHSFTLSTKKEEFSLFKTQASARFHPLLINVLVCTTHDTKEEAVSAYTSVTSTDNLASTDASRKRRQNKPEAAAAAASSSSGSASSSPAPASSAPVVKRTPAPSSAAAPPPAAIKKTRVGEPKTMWDLFPVEFDPQALREWRAFSAEQKALLLWGTFAVAKESMFVSAAKDLNDEAIGSSRAQSQHDVWWLVAQLAWDYGRQYQATHIESSIGGTKHKYDNGGGVGYRDYCIVNVLQLVSVLEPIRYKKERLVELFGSRYSEDFVDACTTPDGFTGHKSLNVVVRDFVSRMMETATKTLASRTGAPNYLMQYAAGKLNRIVEAFRHDGSAFNEAVRVVNMRMLVCDTNPTAPYLSGSAEANELMREAYLTDQGTYEAHLVRKRSTDAKRESDERFVHSRNEQRRLARESPTTTAVSPRAAPPETPPAAAASPPAASAEELSRIDAQIAELVAKRQRLSSSVDVASMTYQSLGLHR